MVDQGSRSEWQDISLGEALDYEQPTYYLVKRDDYESSGTIPVLTAGKTFILGFTEEHNGVFDNLPTILFDDFTTSCHYVDFNFKVKSSACKMLKARNSSYNLKYLYYVMKHLPFEPYDHKRYWISEYSKIKVQMPGIEEQNLIAEALNDIDELIESTKVMRTKKIRLKKGYLDSIISGDNFVSKAIKIKLEDYLDFFNGYSFQSSTYSSSGHYLIRISNVQSGQLVRNDDVCVNLDNNKLKQFELNAGDIVISLTGNVGRTAIIKPKDIPAALNQRVGKIEIKINKVKLLNKNYLYQILQSQQFMDLVIEMGEGAAQKNVSLKDIGSIEWYIPEDSEEQLRISNFLNDLDSEIALLENALQKYEWLKQGMMNDLLTGKVRLV